MLAYITGTVDQELLLRNEYLAAENHILKGQIKGRLLLCDGERATLAEIAYRLGRKALEEVALAAKPETILGWYRKFVAKKFDGSKSRSYPGRPRIKREIESLIVRMAKENPSWGYDRVVGALGNLGYPLSDQTVGNILRRHGVAPAPQRKHTVRWKDFIRNPHGGSGGNRLLHGRSPHVEGPGHILRAVLHSPGEPARVYFSGITRHPDQEWMEQQARSATLAEWGSLHKHKYLLRNGVEVGSFRC
jgi:putative transposase